MQIRKDCNVIYDLLCHDLAIAYYIFNTIPTVLYCNKNNDSIFCILKFNQTICHFYCSRINTKKISNCSFINDKFTYSYDDTTKKLQICQKNKIKEEKFQEYPLSNQLKYFETKFISDLYFAEKIHEILQLFN